MCDCKSFRKVKLSIACDSDSIFFQKCKMVIPASAPGFFQQLVRFMGSATIYAGYCALYGILVIFNGIYRNFVAGECCQKTRIRYGRILWRRKFHAFEYTSVRDFLCLYTSTVEHEYLMKHNVTLYAISEHEAIFIEVPEDINIHSSDENSFFHMAQFNRSTHVMKMPINIFHELAMRLGNPSIPVSWISSTSRCGSTLLCQILENVPGTLLLSEPDAPTNIDYMTKIKTVSENERIKLITSAIRFLCKPSPSATRICIKTRGACASLMGDISKLFPDIRQIFMYRNCQETMTSLLGFLSSMPYTDLGRIAFDSDNLSFLKPFFRQQSAIYFLPEFKDYPTKKCRYSNTAECLAYMWALYIIYIRDFMSRDASILPIKYEDLVAEKRKMCEMIFERLDINVRHLNDALRAFDKDSQRGSIVSQNKIGNTPRKKLTVEDRRNADVILSIFKLPPMGDDFRFHENKPTV